MKIGMNMLVWTAHVTQEHYPIIDTLKETGFDGIELFLGAGDSKQYSGHGRHFSEMELGVTCVTCLTPETNIASPKKEFREAGLDQLKWAVDMCSELNAEVLCGPYHSTNSLFTGKPPTADEKKWSTEILRKVAEYALPSGLILTPEALNRFECYLYNTMEDLTSLVEQIDSPNLGAMYDTHHAHIEEKSQSNAIKLIAPYLKHVHISENDRGTPGSGLVHWNDVFTALKEINYDGWLTIEAFSRLDPDFANAINVWRDFSPAVEIYTKGLQFIKKGMGI
ncbi:MAG: sugar phosphate isomerase/epimerase [Maribacter sp.]|nr:sugar phosphate isomerase/epimerase [Maribacter sp.]MBT8313940.1 sugar phosphate isomerase/epimerase [Maribacter sp.]